MRYSDYISGKVNVSRLEERRGWLGANQRDPGADPPDLAGCRLHPITRPDDPKRDEQ